MLPAMVKPTSLDTQDLLLRFLAYPLATDLNRVTELDLTVLKECDVRGILNETGDILQRCCALRKLTIDNAREDTFKLAMNEQKLYNQLNHKTGLSRSHQDAHAITEWEGYVSSQSELQHKGLVPLEEFNIYNWSLPSTEVMDDVVTTFSKTLKRLCAIEYSVVGDSAALSTYCHIGGNWVDLRLLTLLSLTTSSRRIVIDRHLLTRCPNLVNIYILDYTEQYNLRDVKTCIPARLRSLESLQLTGWSALTFHSETLHSTNRLKDLSITILGFDSGDHVYSWDGVDDFIFCDHYIPPIEDLYRSYDLQNDSSTITLSLTPAHIRPKWTWDWHLPQLVLLELSSEFAFLFQFRMLQGCPALQSLELEIRTPTSSHRRTITSIDMFTPNPSCDPIIVPYLIKLRMHGPWRFTDPSMVSSFLTGMFPSLESFSALGLDGLPLSDLIQWIRGAPKPPIKELFLDTSYFCDTEDMKKLKLVGKKDRGEYGEKDILTTVTIFNEQFFLLR
ncbi:hypothetical protein BGZ96_007334 [Linnemannia gamsii]|uniref:F-box domain-containing protein n=1 Tax=Linnemannia gamsii TaxID=64522 RepID=A0ABQ7K0Q2_9FUNG|nr:hypothetical protein BGZ96_007334 [Linnemannia gamsii]